MRSLLAAMLLLLPGAALAQGSFTMPLPDASLPLGTVTVKVTGGSMSDKKVGTEVLLLGVSVEGQTSEVSRAKSGEDGRARFSDLKTGASYQLTLVGEGKQPASAVFSGPAEGGLRFLVSLGGANPMAGGAMPGGASGGGMPGQGAMPADHPPTSGHGMAKKEQSKGAAKIEPTDLVEAGNLLVRVVKGKAKTPVKGAVVMITANPAAAATPGKVLLTAGEGLKRRTDEKGEVKVALPADKGGNALILAAHDELTYRSRPLTGAKDKGLLATFQVFDRTASKAEVTLGPGTQMVAQVVEKRVSFMQVLRLSNNGDTIFDPGKTGMVLPLPGGASNVEFPEQFKGLVATDEDKRELRLIVPLPPGDLEVRYFFEVSFSGNEVELVQTLPLASAGASISVINKFPVKVSGPQVTGSGMREVEGPTASKRLVYTLDKVPAGGKWELLLSGLPAKDERATWAVLGLAGLLLVWGVGAAAGGAAHARRRREEKDALLDRLASGEAGDDADALRARVRELLQEEHM